MAELQRARYAAEPEKNREIKRRWIANNPENAKRAFLKQRLKRCYRISIEEYEAMVSACGGLCAICDAKTDDRLHVDHDHVTGKIRGLLCNHCNLTLGHAGDSAERLRRAADYLTKQS